MSEKLRIMGCCWLYCICYNVSRVSLIIERPHEHQDQVFSARTLYAAISGFNNVTDRCMGNSSSTFNCSEAFIYTNVAGLFLLTHITILYRMA